MIRGKRLNPQQSTKFVNFERYFNANKDEAQQAAGGVQDYARKQAEAARTATQTAMGQMAQQSGSQQMPGPQAPGQAAKAAMATNVGGNAVPQGNVGAAAMAQPRVQAGEAVAGPAQKQQAPGLQNQVTGDAPYYATEPELAAAGQYGGPNTLGETEGSLGAYEATSKAAASRDALGSADGVEALQAELHPGQVSGGSSSLDAGLTRQAGGRDFSKFRQQFDPEGELRRAEKEAENMGLRAQGRATDAQRELERRQGNARDEKRDTDEIARVTAQRAADQEAEIAAGTKAGEEREARFAAEDAATNERRKSLGSLNWNTMNGLTEDGAFVPFGYSPLQDFDFTKGVFEGMSREDRLEMDDILGMRARGETGWMKRRDEFVRRVKAKAQQAPAQTGTNRSESGGNTPQR